MRTKYGGVLPQKAIVGITNALLQCSRSPKMLQKEADQVTSCSEVGGCSGNVTSDEFLRRTVIIRLFFVCFCCGDSRACCIHWRWFIYLFSWIKSLGSGSFQLLQRKCAMRVAKSDSHYRISKTWTIWMPLAKSSFVFHAYCSNKLVKKLFSQYQHCLIDLVTSLYRKILTQGTWFVFPLVWDDFSWNQGFIHSRAKK